LKGIKTIGTTLNSDVSYAESNSNK